MAIDTAAKRRNVGRLLSPTLFIGLGPNGSVDTNQRVNAGLGYVGLEYGDTPAAGSPFTKVSYSGLSGNFWRIKITSR